MAFNAVRWNQGCGGEAMLGYAYADMKSDALRQKAIDQISTRSIEPQ